MLLSTPWIIFRLCALLLTLLCAIPSCRADVTNAVLSSTEYSVTVTFDVDLAATNYSASFMQTLFLNWRHLEGPYDDSRISLTYDQAQPGYNYTVQLYENTTDVNDIVFNGTIATVPLPPVNVSVADRGTSFLFIEWDSQMSYSSHQISYRKDTRNDMSLEQIVNGTGDNFFNLTDLDPGFKYDISVRAISFYSGGSRRGNRSQSISNFTLPAKPVMLMAEALNTSHISLTWEAELDSYQDSYQVKYYTQDNSNVQDVMNCTASPCTFAPGTPTGQVVTVMVYSVSDVLISDAAEIRCSTEPGRVNDFTVTQGVRSLTITWTPPSASVVSSYVVMVTNTRDNTTKTYNVMSQEDNTPLNHVADQLRGGTAYQVSVAARTQFATGKGASHIFYTVPEPVSGLKAVAVNTIAISISWSNPEFSEIKNIGIEVIETGLMLKEPPTSEVQVVTGLNPGELYHVSVTVLTEIQQLKSEVMNVTANTKPVMPKLVSSLSKENELRISVNLSENIGVYDNFHVILQGSSGTIFDEFINSSTTIEDLVPGTAYNFTAYTVSGVEESEPLSVTLFSRPRPPRNLVVDVINGSTINVEWDLPEEGGYDNFTVTLEESEGGSPAQARTTTDSKIDFKTTNPGTMYNVTIVTVRGDQTSMEISEQNTTAPLNVKDVRVGVRGVTTVTLVWDPPVASDLDGYALTFAPTNQTLLELLSNVTQFKLDELQPDTDYVIQIFTFALRPDGVKLFSPARQFNFSTYPESVAALQKVDATSDSITVNWTAPVSGNFNLYQLGLREDTRNPQMYPFLVARNTTNNTFELLKPGQMYTIAIRTVLRIPNQRLRYGSSASLTTITKPLPVMDLAVIPINTSAVTVKWTVNQTSQQNSFLISYGPGSTRTVELDVMNFTLVYETTIDQLLSGTENVFEVLAKRTIDGASEESELVRESGFTVPLPISNLTVAAEANTLQLTWEPPVEGNWESYRISYRPVLRRDDETIHMATAGKDNPRIQVPDLFPGEKYEVNVSSISHGLNSDEVSGSKILDPLMPQEVTQDKQKTTTTSVTIGWTYNADSYYVESWAITYTDGDGVVNVNEPASEKSEYSVTLIDLKPGQTYSVKLKSVVLTVQSPMSELNVTAKPVITSELEEISTTNSSLRMGYTVDPGDIFENFFFSIVNQAIRRKTKAKADSDHKVGFEDLQAGTLYKVRANTVSNGEESSPLFLEFVTDPNPVPVDLKPTARDITLTLGSQPGDIASHTISCSPKDATGAQCAERTKTVDAGAPSVVFSGLSPFTTYSFEVVTTTQKANGRAKNASMAYDIQTAQAAPSMVQELRISDKEFHSLSVSWKPPVSPNGELRNYIISYHGREPDFPEAPVDQNILTVDASVTNQKLDGLRAGYEYLITVFAKTVADGPPSKSNATLPTGRPAFKSGLTAESSKPTPPQSKAVVTTTKLSLLLVNPFSFDQGYIRQFTVIVSKDPKVDDSATSLPTWNDARKDSSIKVYQAIEKCEDFFTDSSPCGVAAGGNPSSRRRRATNTLQDRLFTLGDQTEAECNGVTFCNGPLETDTEYYVKLRGFTSSGEFSETVYSEPIKTAEGSTSSATAVIAGSVVAAVVIIAIIIGIVFWRRRHKPKKATKHNSNANWDQASSLNKLSRVVKLANFEDYVRKMAADSDFKYAEEYEDLKEIGRGQPTLAAEFPPNRPKNRFTNILPYDHSRVKLLPTDDEEGSDYINANYMPGYSSKREYIATQGPLPGTRDDIWRMLWEQSSRNIVMLTKCQESGREKSDHYWPTDMEPKYYGDLQVVILAETPMPDWTITDLKVSLGEESRIIRHFHYRSWPDFGVPPNPSSLLRFVRTVRERLINEGGPFITHCSAGVGRSGTFIILDHLLQLIREKDEVDIFSMVYKLRKERVLMVQTEKEPWLCVCMQHLHAKIGPMGLMTSWIAGGGWLLQQYKFIHECLLCVLQNREEDTTYANVGQVNIGYEGD